MSSRPVSDEGLCRVEHVTGVAGGAVTNVSVIRKVLSCCRQSRYCSCRSGSSGRVVSAAASARDSVRASSFVRGLV